jgi:hypothetical protein
VCETFVLWGTLWWGTGWQRVKVQHSPLSALAGGEAEEGAAGEAGTGEVPPGHH